MVTVCQGGLPARRRSRLWSDLWPGPAGDPPEGRSWWGPLCRALCAAACLGCRCLAYTTAQQKAVKKLYS